MSEAMSKAKPLTVFMMVKTLPPWLRLSPKERFEFVDTVLKPVIGKHPGVALRFFDVEAYSTVCSDMLMWEVHDQAQYQSLVEHLRETLFWDTYFDIVHILPSVEDAYADHYEVDRVGA